MACNLQILCVSSSSSIDTLQIENENENEDDDEDDGSDVLFPCQLQE